MVKVGVVGATGYAGEELIKILIRHKDVDITELSAVIDKEEAISSIFCWESANRPFKSYCLLAVSHVIVVSPSYPDAPPEEHV